MEKKRLTDIAYILSGYAFKSSKYVNSGVRIIRIANVQDGYILDEKPCFYSFQNDEDVEKYYLEENDLLLSLTGNVGRVGLLTKAFLPAALNQRVACIRIKDEKVIDKKFLFYYLRKKRFVQDCIMASKGVAQLNLSTKWLEHYPIPVLPLSEQKRIVARIEELFSQLDDGVNSLLKTKEQLEIYREIVLKEAFDGKLTAKWRETHLSDLNSVLLEIQNEKAKNKNGVKYHMECEMPLAKLPNGWCWVYVGNISKGVEYGSSQKSLKQGKVPVIRMGNLQNGEIVWDNLAFSSDDAEIEKYRLEKGDVLFNRTNSPELVGKTAIYRGEREALFAGYLIRVNQLECINPGYLTRYLNSFTAKNYGNKVKTDGVNQSNINGAKLCSYPFPLCSLEEQNQVVYELETRLSVCDSINRTVEIALQQAAAIRQSILKKAFEGNL